MEKIKKIRLTFLFDNFHSVFGVSAFKELFKS